MLKVLKINALHQKNILRLLFFIFLFTSMQAFATTAPPPQKIITLHDPTQPIGISSPYGTTSYVSNKYGIKIDAIIISKNKKIAIINGQQISVGDKFMGLKVVDISSNEVKFADNNGEFTVPMLYLPIKTPTTPTKGASK